MRPILLIPAACLGLMAFGAAAQPSAPPKTTDSSTPADAASGATTSMGQGSGTSSEDSGVTNLGAEAAHGRTAGGNVALPANVLRGLAACRSMSREAQIESRRCRALANSHPAEFNPDGTVRPVAR